MLKQLILLTILSLMASTTGFTCTVDGSEGFVPENNLKISTNAKSMMNSNLDEAKFNEVIDSVVKIYDPIVTAQGGSLNVERNWEDGTVNAYASRRNGKWNVAMFGGLARHETVTPDGFALVVCHELGHHIGGAPKKVSRWSSSWASNEGQSDYFATLKCLRKVFRTQDNKAVLSELEVPAAVITTCTEQFSTELDQLICQRSSMAGFSTASLFQALRSQSVAPAFTTPDDNIVTKTDDNHPATQCRLDTYFAGAICQMDDMADVSTNDEASGVCYRENGDTIGTRSFCWFKPKAQ